MATDEALAKLQAHVRYRLGGRVQQAAAWRVDELTRLAVRHWPHKHLEAAMAAGGKNDRGIDHALVLCRAQVREQWEARQGVSPLWDLVLAGLVDSIGHVILAAWAADDRMRASLRSMSRRAADTD